ncbi:SH3 domain-containing protein [Acidisphaera sp. S103]|uniref:SH3 domain-containing protein n=1 Tax=Acidisphaera sp. S103 TaxID=1747223 RepID=UPI00131D78DB|nr:SH3 domain-containing protein [Acidisphaera sp. S103]
MACKQTKDILSCALLIATLFISGCNKDKCQTTATPEQYPDVRESAEMNIRSGAKDPGTVQFRGVQVWPQAIGNTFAVCGQTDVFGANSVTYVLFVAVVTRNDSAQDPGRRYSVETLVGSTTSEATKAYVETLTRCFDGGGPKPLPHNDIAPVPILPDNMAAPQQAVTAPAAPTPPPPPAGQPVVAYPTPGAAQGDVVMAQNGNIHSSPQGPVIGVEHEGTELHVFSEARGGWLQVGVGDTQPIGWVYEGLVRRH